MTEEKCHSLTPLSLPGIPCGRRCPRPHVRVWLGQILGCEAGKVLRHRCSHTRVCVCARPGTHVPAPVTSLQTEPQTADQHLRLCPQTNVSPPSFHRNSRTVTCGSPPLKIIVSRNLFVTEVFRFANPLMKNLCFVL